MIMTERRPLILIVNDDGYEAKGLEAMVSIAKPLGEVVVVVPDRTRSGMGHAITMAAAIEGAFDNIPAVGLSLLDYSANADFSAVVHYGRPIVEKVLKNGLPPHICLNINFPKVPVEEIQVAKNPHELHC